jgi:hypothetical protein
MTTSQARGIKPEGLNDASVAEYLQTYPDFFERNSAARQAAAAASARCGRHGEPGRAAGGSAARAQSVARAQVEGARRCGPRQRRARRSHPSAESAADPRAYAAETINAIETSCARISTPCIRCWCCSWSRRGRSKAAGRFLRTGHPGRPDIKTFESLLQSGKPRCGQSATRSAIICSARTPSRSARWRSRRWAQGRIGDSGHRRERRGPVSSGHEHGVPVAHRRARDLRLTR